MAIPAANPVQDQAQLAKEISAKIDAAYETDSKKIVYRNDLVALIVQPSRASAIRGFFKRDEVVFAYQGTKNVWYQTPMLVQDTGAQTIIYRSNFPRDREPPEYTPFMDKKGRKFLLVQANGGYIPVRHGTDPVLGNWLSPNSQVKIVYDSKGFRHPALDIDYTIMGMKLFQGRIWWPRFSGPFKHSYKRIRTPYYEDFDQIAVPEQVNPARVLFRPLLFLAAVKFRAPAAIAQGIGQQARRALGHELGNAVAVQQAYGPEIDRDAMEHQRAQEFRRQEFHLQKNVLDALNEQESQDFSEEIARALQVNSPFEEIQALFQHHAYLLAEHRGFLAKKAASFGKTEELGLILASGEIPQADRGQLLVDSVGKGSIEQVRFILGRGHLIPDEPYSQAVVLAAKFGSSEILQLLLVRNILDAARGQAAVEAVARGSEQDLDLLLRSGPLPIEKRGEACIAASRQAQSILEKVLSTGPLLIEHRGEAVIESVKLGKFGHMRLLLPEPNCITEKDRGLAALAAARQGKREIVIELGLNGPISQNDKEEIGRIFQQR